MRFFNYIFEEELGAVQGHFGPVNTISFSPDGQSYASGGEDGYVRLFQFSQDYYDMDRKAGLEGVMKKAEERLRAEEVAR